jgi:hypothetical protein
MEHAIGGSALGGGGCASEGRTKRSMAISPGQAVIHDSRLQGSAVSGRRDAGKEAVALGVRRGAGPQPGVEMCTSELGGARDSGRRRRI